MQDAREPAVPAVPPAAAAPPANPLQSLARWLGRAVDPRLTERLMTLRRQREQLARPLRRGTSLVVVGPEPRAGRTTIAGILAMLLAEYGPTRVLAVDADTRSPGLRLRLAAHTGGSWHGVLAGLRLVSPGTVPVPAGPGFHWFRQHLAATSGPDLLAVAPWEIGRALTAKQYQTTVTKLGRWYRTMVTDTPAGLADPVLYGAVMRADRILIVGSATHHGVNRILACTQQIHGVRSLAAPGLARCVLVRPGTAEPAPVDLAQAALSLPVHVIPHDEFLTLPGWRWAELSDRTRAALLGLLASTISGLEQPAEHKFGK